MKLLSLLPAVLLAGAAAAADAWSFKDGVVAVSGKDGVGAKTTFSPKSPATNPLTLTTSQSLKLSLNTLLAGTDKAPHQAHLLLSNNNIETSYPLSVKSSGKASLTLSAADLPLVLLNGDSIQASLILGGFEQTTPLEARIFDFQVTQEPGAEPLPTYATPERFSAKPEIHHIFRADQKMPPKIISIVFTLAVIGTLPVLFGSWLLLGGNVSQLPAALGKAPLAHVAFFGSLVAMEGVFAMYYLQWKLGKVLIAVGVIGVVGVVSGSKALSEVQVRRLEGKR